MDNNNRCAAEIWHDYHNYRCERQAGWGEDGLYCKAHAKQHPAKNAPTKTTYYAEYGYNLVLAKVEISAETTKTYTVAESINIVGNAYLTPGLRRKHPNMILAESETEAMSWLLARITTMITTHENELAALRAQYDDLRRFTEE